MVTSEDSNKTHDAKDSENVEKNENLFSPRFRSVAAMAGWDEEALLVATLIVEDTPDRQSKQKKRLDLQNFKTPPSNSRRKRKVQRRSPVPIVVLDLEEKLDESTAKQEKEKVKVEANVPAKEDGEANTKAKAGVSSSNPVIPCIDRLREELSCAICLEICYEPSSTPCGHSFCQKCLRSAADKCGKRCPKCRQLISNGRYCTVNTVLWNTIQLLFPQEVETRKAAAAEENLKPKPQSPPKNRHHHNTRNHRSVQALNSPESVSRDQDRRNHRNRSRSSRPLSRRVENVSGRRRELPPVQNEDAAMALRLQREEFMEAFREPERQNALATARDNLRAMATRAMNIRIRERRN